MDDKYKQFFLKFWSKYTDQEMDLEAGQDLVDIAIELGLASAEEYDSDIHGDLLAEEWGLEKGDICYCLTEPKP